MDRDECETRSPKANFITHGQGLRLVKDQCKFDIYKRRWAASGDVMNINYKVMNIKFDNEEDRLKFKNWLYEVQGLSCEIETTFGNPKLFDDPLSVAKEKSRKLWYRIFDIDVNKI